MRCLKIFLIVFGLNLVFNICLAQMAEKEMFYEGLYKNALQAIEERDFQKADFYLVRYICETSFDENTDRYPSEVIPLFDLYKGEHSPSSISNLYAPDFVKWFLASSYIQWGLDYVMLEEETGAFELVAANDDDNEFFVSVIAYPYIEAWSIAQHEPSFVIIVLGDFDRKPYIISGKLDNNIPSKKFDDMFIDTEGHALHYVWPPEFHDLDRDGIPEIWLRYNFIRGNGFTQELAIYKIQNDEEIVLLRKFTGPGDGIARRFSDNKVEVGWGYKDKYEEDELGYDMQHFETWEYKAGSFYRTEEYDIAHALLTSEWQKYYF